MVMLGDFVPEIYGIYANLLNVAQKTVTWSYKGIHPVKVVGVNCERRSLNMLRRVQIMYKFGRYNVSPKRPMWEFLSSSVCDTFIP